MHVHFKMLQFRAYIIFSKETDIIFIINHIMCKFFIKCKEADTHNYDLHANTNSAILLTQPVL